jgi:hypothetical protein
LRRQLSRRRTYGSTGAAAAWRGSKRILSRAVLEATAGHRSDGEARRVRLDDFIIQVRPHTVLPEAEALAGTAAVLAALRQGLSEDR